MLRNPKSLGGVRKLLPGAHWEVRLGTHEQARAYCTKGETRVTDPVELGVPPEQGHRSDLGGLCDLVVKGSSNRDLAEACAVTYVRNYRGLAALRMAIAPARSAKTITVVLWGPTGCGKSRYVHSGIDPGELYTKDATQWWPEYSGERFAVLDEFYGQLRHEYMLKLMDRYPLRVEFKGGYAEFNSRVLFITSNRDPREWYSGLTEQNIDWQPQFFRRIDAEFQFAGGRWLRADYSVTVRGFRDPIWTETTLPDAQSWAEPVAGLAGSEQVLTESMDL